ncbi:MAG: ribbon-helix-helix domain-containing protein [Planctomycetes bacterium]|nr:ribbon-helix-helix domain-containing protein [Planctomycetota bacterium]
MAISLRLNEQLERQLELAARREGLSKSELVRRSLQEFLARRETSRLPWELGQHVFGRYGSGRGDLSANRKRLVRERIHARKRRV